VQLSLLYHKYRIAARLARNTVMHDAAGDLPPMKH